MPHRQNAAAARRTGLSIVCVGGGVAANRRLRDRLTAEAERLGFELHIPPLRLCTDNAVMGAIAIERLKAGLTEPLDLDVFPGLLRATAAARSHGALVRRTARVRVAAARVRRVAADRSVVAAR